MGTRLLSPCKAPGHFLLSMVCDVASAMEPFFLDADGNLVHEWEQEVKVLGRLQPGQEQGG